MPGNPNTGVNNYFASGVQTTTRNAFGIKLDEYLTPTQRLSGRYTWDKATLISPLYFGGPTVADPGFGPTIYPRNGVALLYTNTLSANLLLDAHAGLNRFGLVRNPISLRFDPGTLGFTRYQFHLLESRIQPYASQFSLMSKLTIDRVTEWTTRDRFEFDRAWANNPLGPRPFLLS